MDVYLPQNTGWTVVVVWQRLTRVRGWTMRGDCACLVAAVDIEGDDVQRKAYRGCGDRLVWFAQRKKKVGKNGSGN